LEVVKNINRFVSKKKLQKIVTFFKELSLKNKKMIKFAVSEASTTGSG
jgi:uncharacterized protein YwgA